MRAHAESAGRADPRLRLTAANRCREKAQQVDFCFLIDATGSMQPWIDQVKSQFSSMVRDLKVAFPSLKLNAAVVAYRDYNDRNHFEVLDFTCDVSKFCDFLAR